MQKFHSLTFDYDIEEENVGRKPTLSQAESNALDFWIGDQFFDGFDGTTNELANQLVDEISDMDTGYRALDKMVFTTTGLIDLVDAVRNGWFTEPDAVVKPEA